MNSGKTLKAIARKDIGGLRVDSLKLGKARVCAPCRHRGVKDARMCHQGGSGACCVGMRKGLRGIGSLGRLRGVFVKRGSRVEGFTGSRGVSVGSVLSMFSVLSCYVRLRR